MSSLGSSLPVVSEKLLPAFETIYRNSQGFGYLVSPDVLVPGSAIRNVDSGQMCSAGWFFDSPSGMVLSTAGHCGVEGNSFVFVDAKGVERQVGAVVYSGYKGKADLGVNDYALIKVDDPVLVGSFVPLDPNIVPVEWQARQQSSLEYSRFDGICGLGFRSGLSCGPFSHVGHDGELFFRRISDSGDSGGPVFGIEGNTLIPLGLDSAGRDEDATLSLNQALDSMVNAHDVELFLDDQKN